MEESKRSSISQVKPDSNYPHPPSPLSHTLLNFYQKNVFITEFNYDRRR